jgi:APA family basic amino acid/polyamine antiporter
VTASEAGSGKAEGSAASRPGSTRPEGARRIPASDAGLVRALGTWSVAAAIVNVTIGGGIFRIPASPEVTGRLGSAAPLAYVICAIAMGLIVLCLAEAASRVAATGGPYAYVEVAFGPFVGYLVGVLLWLTSTVAFAAVATIFADNAARLIPPLAAAGARAGLLVSVILLLAASNVIGVRQGSRINVVSAIVKLAPLLLLIIAGVFAIDPAHLRWTEAPGVADLSRASIFLVFAFAGIESALVPSGEVREPARTVPRAIFLAMGIVTVIYLLIQTVAQGTLGPALVGTPTPLADAAGRILGAWGAALLSAGVVLSTLGYLSGMTLAVPRALYAFARDGFLPRGLAAVHRRFHTPHVAIVVQCVVVVVLALTSGFEGLALIATSATLLVYLGCCVGAWELRRRDVRGAGEPFKVPGAAVVPVLACVVILYLLSSVTLREWGVLAATVVLAAVVFFVTRGRRQILAPATDLPAA